MNLEIAKIAYMAYSETTNNKNFMGNEMPKYDDLPTKIKEAWLNASKAITTDFVKAYLHGMNVLENYIQLTEEECEKYAEEESEKYGEFRKTKALHLKTAKRTIQENIKTYYLLKQKPGFLKEENLVQRIPAQEVRMETGPMQFGDDWKGLFLRGDYCAGLWGYLHDNIKPDINPIIKIQIEAFEEMLLEVTS